MERVRHRFQTTWTVQLILMILLWFLFVAKIDWAEAAVGVAAAALAATGDMVIRRGRFAKFRPKPQWLLEFWREPGYVLHDLGMILWALCRRLLLGKRPDCRLRNIPFDPGGPTGRSAARRALAITLTT